ncbi:MAG: four helix bundle protein [Balneolaceae bacterium]
MKKDRKYDLHDRLIEFSISIIEVVEKLPKNYAGIHFAKQLVRSGTAPAFNHAEAQSAESRRDFIHKMKIAVKELRETYVNLKIIRNKPLLTDDKLESIIKECNELVSIFVRSIQTARKNMNQK